MRKTVEIFIAYSRRDTTLLDEFRVHLKPLERTGKVQIWYDGLIEPGAVWEADIKKHLHASDIILLLVSADAIASDYFYDKEVADALERHHRGEARVVPMIMRPCAWGATPLAELQALPKNGKPVTTWPDHDEAFADAAKSLWTMIIHREQLEAEEAEQDRLQKEAAEQKRKAAQLAKKEETQRRREAEAEAERAEQERLRREAEAQQTTAVRREAYNDLIARASAWQKSGDWAKARSAWQQALTHYEPGFPESPPELRDNLAKCNAALQQRAEYARCMAEAQKYLSRRNWPRTIAAANDALKAIPGDAAAQRLREQAQAGSRKPAPPKPRYLLWAGIAAGVLLAVFIIAQVASRPGKEREAARAYAEAWRKTEERNTLPAWRDFLALWPEGPRQEEARRRLKELEVKFDNLVKSAEALQNVKKDTACQYLQDALIINPNEPKVLELMKKIGCR